KPPRVGLVSLGCPKNLVDSERIMTKLRSEGYDMSPDYEGADVVLVNTCGFLDSAKEESLEAIGEAIAENGRAVVTGCFGKEAEKLVEAGTKELLVISQDTSAYGVDIRKEPRMWKGREVVPHMTDLARELGRLGAWVRLHYVYPYPHVDSVIPLMAEGLVLPYLDIPFQHASRSVLRAMRRPANEARVLERLKAWRQICPDIAIRSTFVVGFP